MGQSASNLSSSGIQIPVTGTSLGIGGAEYVYTPIEQDGRIRVLTVHPGGLKDDIVGDLAVFNISPPSDYNAISYSWADENGDDSKSSEIYLGAMRVPLRVTRNCASALRRIRNPRHAVRVWVDAVCIDQNNVQERNHQVNLMRKIYTQAATTYVYLGESDDQSDELLQNLAGGDWAQPHLLENLLRRRYFSRLWVLQEVTLSKHVVVICGATKVPLSVFAPGNLTRIYTTSYYNSIVPPLFTIKWRPNKGPPKLLDLLLHGRKCQATNPKDKVFAVLGMIEEKMAEKYQLCADYTQSIEQVYTSAARYLATAEGNGANALLGNISSPDPLTEKSIEYCLPTWVPDWSHHGATFLDTHPETREYLGQIRPHFHQVDNSAMYLDGFILGSLTEFIDGLRWEFEEDLLQPRRYSLLPRYSPSSQASKLLYHGGIPENVFLFQEWTRTEVSSTSLSLWIPWIRFRGGKENEYAFVLECLERRKPVAPIPMLNNLPQVRSNLKGPYKDAAKLDPEEFSEILDQNKRQRMLDWVKREPFSEYAERYRFLGLAKVSGLQVIVWDDRTRMQRIRIV